ncbi:MAG: hypothetical protein E8D46_04225 [Nitrospira sp.]|nr:MAG: hypothetical protein E8D46_04225 [Nitrospira sp.]
MSGIAVRRVAGMLPWNLVCGIVIFVVIGLVPPVMGSENELLSKEEWSILQSLEYRYRDSPSSDHLLLIEHSGKHLAGILSTHGSQRLWMLLDPDHKPFVKQLPKGDYHINSMEFERISAFAKVHPEVQSALKKSARATLNSK